MTTNKMPEMPEAPKDQALSFGHTSVELLAFAEAYGRACYLAAIEAARACVQEALNIFSDPRAITGFESCKQQILANLTALEQEAKK